MKFKIKSQNTVYKADESFNKKTEPKQISNLTVKTDTDNTVIFDIKNNQELHEDAKEQWQLLFSSDLRYFSWNNFIHSVSIFIDSGKEIYDPLAQIVKDQISNLLKEKKKNKIDYFASALEISKRIHLLKFNADFEIPFLSSLFKLVYEEINEIDDFWEDYARKSVFDNDFVTNIHLISNTLNSENGHKVNAKLIDIYKRRYKYVKQSIRKLDDFISYVKKEIALANKMNHYFPNILNIRDNMFKVVLDCLLNENLEIYLDLGFNDALTLFQNSNQDFISSLANLLELRFDKRIVLENFAKKVLRKLSENIIKTNKYSILSFFISRKKDFRGLLKLTDTLASYVSPNTKHLILLAEQNIMSCIEELNGVDRLISILNSDLIKCYQSHWRQDEVSKKIFFYLKKLINQDIVEETYRTYLLKRISFIDIMDFSVEFSILAEMEKVFGLKVTYQATDILKNIESIKGSKSEMINLIPISSNSLTKAIKTIDFPLDAIQKLDSDLGLKAASGFKTILGAYSKKKEFSDKKLSVTLQGNIEFYFPSTGGSLTVSAIQGLVILANARKGVNTLSALSKMFGFPADLLLLELNPLTSKKVAILAIQGDKLVVDWNNLEKCSSQKKVKTFKIFQEIQSTVSVDVQKRILEAACVKFLKRKKVIPNSDLQELVQKDLLQYFETDVELYKECLDKLIKSEYCRQLDKNMLEYLP